MTSFFTFSGLSGLPKSPVKNFGPLPKLRVSWYNEKKDSLKELPENVNHAIADGDE
jgi:hypothetical protein